MSNISPTQAQAEPIGDPEPEKALLERVAADREVAAMEQLYVLMRPRLVKFLGRMSSDAGLIEEAYNDIMIKVWDNAAQFQGRSKATSWIYSIGYRTCLRLVKRQQRQNSVFQLIGESMEDLFNTTDEDLPEPDMDVADAVQQLSAKQRLVVELCYFEGYSLEEISHIANCPLNTVKTRLHHARKRLREILSAEAAK